MTIAHVEKFAELVAKDPALLAKLGLDKVNADAAEASASAAAFIINAVKEAKALGLEFTEEEARAFMMDELKFSATDELSDTQLEVVAGGKYGGVRPLPGPWEPAPRLPSPRPPKTWLDKHRELNQRDPKIKGEWQ